MDFVALTWLALVLVHIMPAAAAFSPRLRQRMYGVAEDGNLAVILAHRGVLFLAVAVACAYAAVNPAARQLASMVAGISVLGFLGIYAAAGMPRLPRSIALVDLVAVPPLAWAAVDAWALI